MFYDKWFVTSFTGYLYLLMWLQSFFTLGSVLPFKHWETLIKQVLLSVQHRVSLERFGI